MSSAKRFSILFACLLTLGIASTAWGQPASSTEEIKLPEPQNMTLETKDGVQLRCTYFPGGVVRQDSGMFERKPGKEVVPIILLHGAGGRRGDYSALAYYLQNQGHAVVVPDLRGHGESTTIRTPAGELEIDPERMRRDDFNAMVLDVEAVKKFLLEKNNAGDLNVEMLCVGGAELGSIVAVNWAALDWSRPQLAFQKQGRDVKALILLSPRQSHKGASMTTALRSPAVAKLLSILILAGEGNREDLSDSKSIFNRIEKNHPEPPPAEVEEKKDLFLTYKPTRLSGVQLIDPRARLDSHLDIKRFIDRRLVNKAASFPWSDRTSPLEAAD